MRKKRTPFTIWDFVDRMLVDPDFDAGLTLRSAPDNVWDHVPIAEAPVLVSPRFESLTPKPEPYRPGVDPRPTALKRPSM